MHFNQTCFLRLFALGLFCQIAPVYAQITGSGCPNADFSSQNFSNWNAYTGNYNNPAINTGVVNGRHTIINAATIDPNTCGGLSTLPPGSAVSARLGNQATGAQSERLSYTLTVDSSNALFIYKYAVVMQDPGHVPNEQPKFDVRLLNSSGQQIGGDCGVYSVTAGQGIPGFQDCGSIRWKDWSVVGLNLMPWFGQQVTLEFTTYDCDLGGHYGYAYIAADCRPLNIEVNYCLGDNAVMLVAPPGFATYTWNSTPVSNNDTLIINNPTLGDTLTVAMTSFTNSGICPVSINAVVYPTVPFAGFELDSQCNNTVSFTDTSTIVNGYIQDWLWDFGDNNTSTLQHPTHTYSAPGNYTVTLIVYSRPNQGGCSDTITKSITIYPPLTANILPSPAEFCQNNPGILLNSTISGGAPPYSLQWFNGPNGTGSVVGTGVSYAANAAGTYSLVVTDSLNPGCPPTIVNRTVVAQPVPIVNAGNNITACPGAAIPLNGVVTNATGGVWSGGAGAFGSTTALNTTYTPAAADIAAGSITLTLTSTGNGPCNAVTDQVTISFTQALNVSVSPNVFCFGSPSYIAATVTGGTPPYTYLWNTGATTSFLSGVPAGTYTVTVTDATGIPCSAVGTVNLTQNPQITLSVPNNSLIACDSTALITISASGGAAGTTYDYLWSTGDTTNSITVPTGSYIVTATDMNGCSASDTIVITSATVSLTASIPQPGPVCFGGTTSLTASAVGGFGNYTYAWSNGATTTSTIVGAGNHCVTVTDSAGCINTACVAVTENSPLNVAVVGDIVICDNATTNITAVASGGTGGYSYAWNTGGTTNTITVPAGNYTVTVTDTSFHNCNANASINITEATPITLNFNNTNPSCFGSSNGQAMVIPSGGIPGYTYFWPVNGSTSNSIFGLQAGSYLVQVTDSMGCMQTGTAVLTQPAQLQVNLNTISSATCYGASNGSATANVSGGTLPYTYFWTPNGATTAIANGFSAGVVTVNVMDSKGCQAQASGVITQPTQVTGTLSSVTHNLCFGQQQGSATVSGNGGTGPYQYFWSNGTNGPTATGLAAGSHTVIITDNTGCQGTFTVIIDEPTELLPFVSNVENNGCFGDSTGLISVAAMGGVPFYTYTWNPPVSSAYMATGLAAGNYTITVTDGNGCQAVVNQAVASPQQLTLASSAVAASCNGVCDGQVQVTPSGGTPAYTYLWSTGDSTSSILTACAGNYGVTVTDSMGCTAIDSMTVTEPAPLAVTLSSVDAHCFQSDGSATVNTTGGTPAYTYLWMSVPTQTTATASNLPPGNYVVHVTDQNNCTITDSVVVGNIPGIDSLVTTSISTTCFGGCDGSASTVPVGGASPYTYAWSNGPTTANNPNLCAGTYVVVATDNFGCEATDTIEVDEPIKVTLAITSASDTICIGESVQINVNASGGSGAGYVYSWNGGSMTGPVNTVSPTVTTSYYITGTDNNNCDSDEDTITIVVRDPVLAAVVPDTAICLGEIASLTGFAAGGNGNYTYSWTPGGATSSSINVTPTVTTTYYLTITDDCGSPSISDSVVVTVNPLPEVNFVATSTSGCSPVCVDFADLTFLQSGNVVGWSWSFGDGTTSSSQNPEHCFYDFGEYDVTLTATTDQGCSSTNSYGGYIRVHSDPIAEFYFLPEKIKATNPNVQFTDVSLDAVNWLWDFGDNDSIKSSLRNPIHFYPDTGSFCPSLTVTNTHGCRDSITKCFEIEPEWSLYVPNAFSPNDDVVNSIFRAYGNNIFEFEMSIYDRWGMLVYRSSDMESGWDGMHNGTMAPIDAYVYRISFKDHKGKGHVKDGHVILVR